MDINKNAPEWKNVGAEPPEELKKEGFKAGYKPPAAYFNWFFNRIYESVKELQIGLSNVNNTSDADKPVSTDQQKALDGKASKGHTHGNAEITDVDASKIKSGTIDIERLPKGALERCVIVASNPARFALTTASVQTGDTVKVTDTGLMYFVVDDTKLSTEAGYTVYTAGQASAVPWSGVTEKPGTFPPSSHTHDDKVTAVGGDIADTKVSEFIASTAAYPVPAAGETTKVGWGKVKKFFEDIKNWMTGVCLIGSIVNNCVTNRSDLPLSAAQGKALMDLFTKLNSDMSFNAKYFIPAGICTYIRGAEIHATNESSSEWVNIIAKDFKAENGYSLSSLNRESHIVVTLPDDTVPDNIIEDGWYNVYTTIDDLKYRWMFHNKAVYHDSVVHYRIQTAYYYMGAGTQNNVLPKQRNIYYNGTSFGYTQWHTI